VETQKQLTTGEKIRQLIKAKGWKQIDVCRAIGLSASRLSNYLSDAREPDIALLAKIAKVLGVGLCAFDPENNIGHEEICPHCGSQHWVSENKEWTPYASKETQELAAVGNG